MENYIYIFKIKVYFSFLIVIILFIVNIFQNEFHVISVNISIKFYLHCKYLFQILISIQEKSMFQKNSLINNLISNNGKNIVKIC